MTNLQIFQHLVAAVFWSTGLQAHGCALKYPALSVLCQALTACHRGSAWAASLELFALLCLGGLGGARPGGEGQLVVLSRLRQRRNLRPDTLSYNVPRGCETTGLSQKPVSLACERKHRS